MDAYREKQLLERIAALEERIQKLEAPWTHNFSGLGYNTTWNTTQAFPNYTIAPSA